MTLRFPSESSEDKTNLFMMTPIQFLIRTQKSMRQRQTKVPKSTLSVILPTPSSGINLAESGSWDESEGYQHNLNKKGLIDFASKQTAKQVIESAGAAGKAAMKGEFINDFAALAYQGSNFREFTFSWDLIPKSKSEAEMITKIIKHIRYFALPDYGNIHNQKTTVDFPWMWDVKPALGNINNIFSMKDCVITNFTTNFTPEGVLKTYNSKHPLAVNMEISFKELYRATDSDTGGSGK